MGLESASPKSVGDRAAAYSDVEYVSAFFFGRGRLANDHPNVIPHFSGPVDLSAEQEAVVLLVAKDQKATIQELRESISGRDMYKARRSLAEFVGSFPSYLPKPNPNLSQPGQVFGWPVLAAALAVVVIVLVGVVGSVAAVTGEVVYATSSFWATTRFTGYENCSYATAYSTSCALQAVASQPDGELASRYVVELVRALA